MAITVPVVAPEIKVHRITIPVPRVPKANKDELSSAGRTAAGYLPPKDQFAYYAGLGALAAFGVIEWPVAAAIGVGTAIARRPQQTPAPGRPDEQGTGKKSAPKARTGEGDSTESGESEKKTRPTPEAVAEATESRKGRGKKS